MKIYRRADFMNLPSGTIFCKGKPWYWENISVKGSGPEYTIDFIEMSLCDIDSEDSGEWSEKLERMLELGESYPLMTDCYGRDGCFDDDDIFLVYEASDLKELIKILQNAVIINEEGKHD